MAEWDATETAARIASGDVSVREVVEAAVTRSREWQPRINAVATPTYEQALEDSDTPRTGPFAGVPTFVKDMEDLSGVPTGFGTAAMTPRVPESSAASVAQFLSTGVIALGKSTTAEFGLTATTEPLHAEPTRNPLDLGRSPGGSSGGAAALVAAGVVPIAHGGDGGGSIRIPAAFCGLVGLKASRGRLVDMATTKRAPVQISTYGVLTRTVRDTAAFYAEVGDERSSGLPPIGNVEGPGKQPLRVGVFIDSPMGYAVHPSVREAVSNAGAALESCGHQVFDVPAPYEARFAEDFLLHWGLLAGGVELAMRSNRHCDHRKLQPWTRALARYTRRRLWKLPGAIWRLKRYATEYERVFESCDVLLSPTAAGPAPEIGHLSPATAFDDKLPRIHELLPYTPVQNASGGPAISLPMGKTDEGLPVAVQLAAALGQERRLLELAFALVDR